MGYRSWVQAFRAKFNGGDSDEATPNFPHPFPGDAQDPNLVVPAMIADSLTPEESVLWLGRPKSMLVLEPADYFAIISSAFWLSATPFILPAPGSPAASGLGTFLFLWWVGPPLASLGAMILWHLGRKSVTYMLTDRRVVMYARFPRLAIRQRSLADSEVRIQGLRRDGSGTLAFLPARPDFDLLDWVVATVFHRGLDMVNIEAAVAVKNLVSPAIHRGSDSL